MPLPSARHKPLIQAVLQALNIPKCHESPWQNFMQVSVNVAVIAGKEVDRRSATLALKKHVQPRG